MKSMNARTFAVIQTHVEIEQWFAGTAPAGTLDTLLGRFSPVFSMITPAGKPLDFAALTQLFGQAGGALLWRHLHETFR